MSRARYLKTLNTGRGVAGRRGGIVLHGRFFFVALLSDSYLRFSKYASGSRIAVKLYIVSVPKYRVLNPARRFRPRRPARNSASCAVNERLGTGFVRMSRMPAIFRHGERAGAHADGVGSAGRSQAARRMPRRR